MLEKEVLIPKYMIIARVEDRPQIIAPTKPTHLHSEPNIVAAVNYSQSVDKDSQMSGHKAI